MQTFPDSGVKQRPKVSTLVHAMVRLFHEMHEWMSMILLVPFALHVWRNWTPLLGYARRRTLHLPLVVSLAVALIFAVPAMSGNSRSAPPFQQVAQLKMDARMADLAPLLKTTSDDLAANLRWHGYQVDSNDDTIRKVAATSGAATTKVARRNSSVVTRPAKRRSVEPPCQLG